jgi:tetratricopeptide (TPR) repeat protein
MIPVLEETEAAINSCDDLETVRDGLPTGMLMIEGVTRRLPENKKARLLAAKLYAGYALAFAEDGDPERATKLYYRARDHGLAVLPGGRIIRDARFRDAEKAIQRLGKKNVPLLFWSAQAWAGAIRIAIDDPRNQAALARVEAMMEQVVKSDPSYYHGAALLFRGVLLGAKPPPAGGDIETALEEIDRAFDVSEGHFLICLYYRAQLLSSLPGREDEAKEVLSALLNDRGGHPDELTFLNSVAISKAEALYDRIIEEEIWLSD